MTELESIINALGLTVVILKSGSDSNFGTSRGGSSASTVNETPESIYKESEWRISIRI